MEEKYKYWLAGILEGEGSFIKGPPSKPNSPIISIQMTDEDVIKQVSQMFGRSYYRFKSKVEKHKATYVTKCTGSKAIALMKELKPLMSIRRQGQIQIAIDSYNPEARIEVATLSRKLSEETVKASKIRIDSGESLRSIARELNVCHESLRRRIKLLV